MNYQLSAYLVYIGLSIIITIWVGRLCYKNGKVFTELLFKQETHLVEPLNKTLLLGYYLLNIGYSLLVILKWPSVSSLDEVFSSVCNNIGLIVFGLGIMHYLNIASIQLWYHLKWNKNRNINMPLTRR